MKGIIFTTLEEVVTDSYGIEVWEESLNQVVPSRSTLYLSSQSYSDEELIAIVHALSEKLSIPVQDLVRQYGQFLFAKLAKKFPIFLEGHNNAKSFLMTVDQVIHIEVEKLFHEPNLPKFDYIDEDEHSLVMLYRSPRKLCCLAEGLILGSGQHFNTDIIITHPVCMHHQSDHCRLELTFTPHE